MKTERIVLLSLVTAGCQLFSGLDGLDVASGGAAPVASSADVGSVASATSGSPSSSGSMASTDTSATTGGGGGGGGPCGAYGEPCCNGQCNEPTLACTVEGTCGGCGEEIVGPGCVRRTDGEVFCWGQNDANQLAIIGVDNVTTPTLVPGVTGATQRGQSATFFDVTWFLRGGRVLAVGDEDEGELGNGLPSDEAVTAVEDIGLEGVVTIGGGQSVSCAILGTGELACAGTNDAGEFLNDNYGELHASPSVVPHGTDNVSVSVYGRSVCTTKIDGSAQCWGYNYPRGMLGNGDTTTDFSPAAVDVTVPPASGGFRTTVAGDAHRCAIGFDDLVYCWGDSGWGELGQPVSSSAVPIVVPNVPPVDRISAGNSFTCVVTQAREVWCFGHNDSGQLAHVDDPSTLADELPAKVDLPAAAVGIDTAYRTACALLVDGSVWCWGGNVSGELGIGTTGNGGHIPQRALLACPP